MRIAQRLQRVGVGGIALAGFAASLQRQLILAKEHLAQLLGAVDVKIAHVRQAVNIAFQLLLARGQLLTQGAQHAAIHRKALALHIKEHAHQRQFNLLIEVFYPQLFHLRLLAQAQRQHPGGVRVAEGGQGVAFLLRIDRIGSQHGIVGNLRQGLSRVGQRMQQALAIVGDHRAAPHCCALSQWIAA